jgi:epoxyqueuosine reductase QueG
MTSIANELIAQVKKRGANFVKAVDISMLSSRENQGYCNALVLGITLSPGYINRLSQNPSTDYSEFGKKEHDVDELADWTADFLRGQGYKAFAQSEKSLLSREGLFVAQTKRTRLPHKKIAIMAGLGWIGKNNLLVTEENGSALCLCTVLTNMPLAAENQSIIMPKCGDCTVCQDVCPAGVLHGQTWNKDVDRDVIVDVYHCRACLKCLALCPWTQKQIKNPEISELS